MFSRYEVKKINSCLVDENEKIILNNFKTMINTIFESRESIRKFKPDFVE